MIKCRLLILIMTSIVLNACTASHRVVSRGKQLSFSLRLPYASEVFLVTSLDNFQPRRAARSGLGVWQVLIGPADEFSYFYLVDGMVFVPECRYREKDDFGADNCLYLADKSSLRE